MSRISHSDTEQADLPIERAELATQPELEQEDLAQIFIKLGKSLAYPRSARRRPSRLAPRCRRRWFF